MGESGKLWDVHAILRVRKPSSLTVPGGPPPPRTRGPEGGTRWKMPFGEYQYSLDDKGRVVIPAPFRDFVEDGLVLTRGMEGCLYVFPLDRWKKIEEQLVNLPLTDAEARVVRLTGQIADLLPNWSLAPVVEATTRPASSSWVTPNSPFIDSDAQSRVFLRSPLPF